MAVVGPCKCDRVTLEETHRHGVECPLSRPPTLTQELIAAGSVSRHGTATMARVRVPRFDEPWKRELQVRSEGEMVVRVFDLTAGSFGSLIESIEFVRTLPGAEGQRKARDTERSSLRELKRLQDENEAAMQVIADLAGMSLLAARQVVRVQAKATHG